MPTGEAFRPVARIDALRAESRPPFAGATTGIAPRALHLNESPFPPSPRVVEAMRRALSGANRYPDHDGGALARVIASHSGVDASRIVIGAGSNELLFVSADLAVDPGDEVVAPVPGFPTFAKSTAMRAGTLVAVPCRSDGCVDVVAVLAAITPKTRLVFVSSPHNPTGGLLRQAEIEALVHGVPSSVLLHFDEAYYEFGRHAGGCETLPLLERRQGAWIATRSLSKAYGVAGMRVGYGLTSSPDLAAAYRTARINFSVGSVAMAGAEEALREEDAVARLLQHNAERRAQLVDGLAPWGWRALPSAANFVAFVTPAPAVETAARLRALGILVSPFALPNTSGALRISTGTQADMQAVFDAVAQLHGRVA